MKFRLTILTAVRDVLEMEQAVILDGIRTPFGNFGGALRDVDPLALGSMVVREVLSRTEISAAAVDELVFGNVIATGGNSIYLARHIGLQAGLKQEAPALMVNRLCGSGLEAVIQAALGIGLGRELVLAGGVENMSQAPYLATGARWGNRMGPVEMVDMLMAGLFDGHANLSMGETAENLAESFQISREEQDAWALLSQERARSARDGGLLAEEIVPVVIKSKRKELKFDTDEFIRDDTDREKLAKLRPVFRKDGTITAANASGINDGASVLLVASAGYARKWGGQPLARILGWGVSGCAPEQMGLGPVTAIPKALEMAGLALGDMDLVEVNEAFAAQFLAVKKELGLDAERTNVNGGAIALGHPLGASGNRVLLTLVRELRRRKGRYGLASLCIGGGQGIAMVVEGL